MTPLELDLSVPSTTPTQHAIAAVVLAILVTAALVIRWRSRVWGLSREQKHHREEALKQKLRQTPTLLQLPSTSIPESGGDLHARVDCLLDRDLTPEDTRTTVLGAVGEVYRAVSIAWAGRVESIPGLALRAVRWAVLVTLFGSVAISTGTVVALLQRDPNAPSLSAVTAWFQGGVETGLSIAGTFPYTGVLWSLAYAYSFMAAEWLFRHWQVVAGFLTLTALAVVILEWRLDDPDHPDSFIRSPRLAVAAVLTGLATVWVVGTSVSVLGDLAGYPGIGDFAGFLLALFTANYLGIRFLPGVVRRMRRRIHSVAHEQTHGVAAYMLLERVIAAAAAVAAGLVALYFVVGVTGGQWRRVAVAFLNASPEVQATLGAAVVALLATAAILIQESWSDVRAALHAVFAQQAVRAQLVRRGFPFLIAGAVYVLGYGFTRRIGASLIAAVLTALVARKAFTLATEAAYRADGKQLLKKIVRPEPMYVAWMAYQLDVDDHRIYLLDVNGRTHASTSRDEVVADAVAVGRALANNEEPPATDTEWYADFFLESGVVDPGDWEEKLDEKIREAALDCLRSDGPQVSRDTWDHAIEDYPETRVRRRISELPFITIGKNYVSLSYDPFKTREEREWPSFSD